jgi:hypothetical protein
MKALQMNRIIERLPYQAILVLMGMLVGCCAQTILVAADSVPSPPSAGEVNASASRVYTFVDKTGIGHQHAIEGKLSGGRLNVGANSDAGQLVFDMQSFDADTLAARKYLGLEGETGESTRKQVNDNMRGRSILDVKRFPTATFDVQSALPTGSASKRGFPIYRLIGHFTLHDQTQPVSIEAEVSQARGWLNVRGSFAIKQTSFGITPYSKAFGTIGVADTLQIHGDIYVVPTNAITMSDIPERK